MQCKAVLTVVATYRLSPGSYLHGDGTAMTDEQIMSAIADGIRQEPGKFSLQPNVGVHVEVTRA